MSITIDNTGSLSRSCLHRQHGVSLLEVMVAVLVLAIGVLGAASLQLNALRFNASAAHSTQASFIAYDILDRMRANADLLDFYATSVDGGCDPSMGTGSSILEQDLIDFAQAVTCQLPQGSASITVAGSRATVSVSWSEDRIVADAEDTQFVVSSIVRSDP
ncbi:MAG TPA: type IV pilus modification protein PilV [Pseudomonas xinjiangensis]|uniref:Type IV pilus modification protein PilV n=2 Tax=root TaxID=1 RepID=A0A7V1BMG4_9GAMM|nr:type IV pilus modification protein PilV [Halopseudomonas xinjiangensis]HEC49229.1 type IV pilus modification protein PilV [Halopseudomonas xinjiangensis]